MTAKSSPTTRRKARKLAVQALYQWQIANTSPKEIEEQFLENNSFNKIDISYFLELLRCIPKTSNQLNELLQPVLDRPMDELNPVELSILRIGVYELLCRKDIPYKVIIDEALRLATIYGAVDGYKYINAVLDRLARDLRSTEKQERGRLAR